MKNIRYNNKIGFLTINKNKSLLSIIVFLLTTTAVFAQWGTVRDTWQGNYDIKMVGSVALQPAIVTSSDGSAYAVDKIATQDMIDQNGAALNNDWTTNKANPAVSMSFPEKAYNGLSVTDLDLANYGKDVCSQTSTSTASNYPSVTKNVAMVYADCDDDYTTFQSSAAYVDYGQNMECTTIQAAYLYWAGNYDTYDTKYTLPYPGLPSMKSYNPGGTTSSNIGGAQVPNSNSYKTVLFKHQDDASYTSITGTPIAGSGTERYVCVADVTSEVQGKKGGLFWVANLRSSSSKNSGGAASGWVLIVIATPPNCPPRVIKLWDGMAEVTAGNKKNITLSLAGMTPATSNFKSYLGIGSLDGENIWSQIYGETSTSKTITGMQQSVTVNTPAECLDVTPDNGSVIHLNPFYTDQPGYPYASSGVLIIDEDNNKATYGDMCNNGPWYMAQDGISSSRITTYLDDNGLNGNETARIPYNRNTLGLDVHHMRMPTGCILSGTQDVTMTYYAGEQGGTIPFLSYIAIETLQPNLLLTKVSDITQAATSTDITYTLTLRNVGGQASLTGADNYVMDTLDLGIDYNSGYTPQWIDKNGVSHSFVMNTDMWLTQTNAGTDAEVEYLKFKIPAAIAACNADGSASDSIRIVFKAEVLSISREDIWTKGCKSVIQNKANVYYVSSSGDSFIAGSNTENGCGGAENTAVTVVDDQLSALLNGIFSVEADLTSLDPTAILVKDIVTDSLRNAICRANGWTEGTHTSEIDAMLPEYTFYDEVFEELTGSEYFSIDKIYQTYYAIRVIEGGDYDCSETYTFTFKVAKIPTMTLVKVNDPLCAGTETGKITAELRGGGSGFGVRLIDDSDDKVIWSSRSEMGVVDQDYLMENIPSGSYTAVLDVLGEIIDSVQITLTDPTPLLMSLTPSTDITVINDSVGNICRNTAFKLTQDVGALTGLDYVWKSSPDSITWTTLAETSNELDVSSGITDTIYYWAYACNTICSVKDVYTVLPTQSLTFPNLTDTICSGDGFAMTPYDSIVAPAMTPTTLTYSWSAPVFAGVTGLAAGTDEADVSATSLVNSNSTAVDVVYIVTPTVDGCEGASFNVTVTVNPKPVINNLLDTICSGTEFIVKPVNVTDGTVPSGTTYTWTAPSYAGITGTTAGTAVDSISDTLTNTTTSAIDVVYTVTPKTGDCSGTPFTVTVKVNPLPTATISNTAGDSICSEDTYALTATATAGTVEWFSDGLGSFTNGTSANATYNSVAGDADTTVVLTMVVTSNTTLACGTDTARYNLYVRPAFDAGAITAGTDSVCSGSTTAIIIGNTQAAIGGDSVITYEWYKDGVAIAGSNAATYTIPNADKVNAGTSNSVITYTRKAKDGTCNTTYTLSANDYKLTVYPAFDEGAIATTGETLCVGGTPTVIGSTTAASGGDGTITYEWYKDGVAIASTNTATYTPPTADASVANTTHTYTRKAKDGSCASLTTSTGSWVLTIRPAFDAGTITAGADSVCTGSTTAIVIGSTTAASGGDNSITYEWYKDGVAIASSDAATYTIPNADKVNATTSNSVITYTRKAKDGACNTSFTQSDSVYVLTVYPAFNKGAIATTGETLCVGGTPTVIGSTTAASGGDGTITYEWYKDGVAIASTNTATYTPPTADALTADTSYTYTRKAKDGTCASLTASTGSWVLTIRPAFDAGTITADSNFVCSGTTTAITIGSDEAATGGDATIAYEWYKDGAAITSSNAATYTIPNADKVNAGTTNLEIEYTRKAKDGACNTSFTLSDSVYVLTVYPAFDAGEIDATGETLCPGATPSRISNTTLATGGDGNITYEWYKDGVAIANSDSVSFTPSTLDIVNAGSSSITITYTRKAKDATCNSSFTLSTNSWVITVNPIPTITDVTLDTICGTGTVNLGATASAGTVNWYSASTGGTSIQSGTTYSQSVTATTTYYVDATANGCTTASRTAVEGVVNALPSILPTTFDVCEGLTINLDSVSGVGDATKPWDSQTLSVATITAGGQVSGVAQGTSLITYTDNNGCTDTVTVTVNTCTALTLDQSTTGSTCQGDTITYTINLVNPSAVSSTGIKVSDVLPASVTYVSSTPTQGTYSAGVWDVGTILSTESVKLTIKTIATTAGASILNESYVSEENGNTYSAYTDVDPSMSDSTVVEIYALPVSLDLTGSTVCYGVTDSITSSTSELGVNYQLYDNTGTAKGGVVAGTGSALKWTSVGNGTGYYVIGTNATTTCVSTSDSVDVVINALPVSLDLTGSVVCAGVTDSITSSTSELGVNYQLYDNTGTAKGSLVAGTGAALKWTSVGNGTGYYVIGTNATTTCVSTSDSVDVVINALPVSLDLTGSVVCSGITDSITSSTSELGVNYQLYDNTGAAKGSVVAGTGSALKWTSVSNGTGYYVIGTNATTTCVSTSDSVDVVINTLPTPLILTGSEVCSGVTDSITSSTSELGVNYQLYDNTGTAKGTVFAGTGAALKWSSVGAGSAYYVIGTNATTTCVSTSDSVDVVINALPTSLNLTGSSVCSTLADSIISDGSQIGVNYQLYDNTGTAKDTVVVGTGIGLTWKSIGDNTAYYVIGTDTATGCVSTSDSVDITVYTGITATVGHNDVTTVNGTDGSLTISSLTGGSGGGVEYRIDTVTGATIRNYNASLTNLPSGTYKVFARNTDQTCDYLLGTETINEPGSIKGSITTDSIKCYGDSTATISIDSVTGGNTPHQFYYKLNKWDTTSNAYVLLTDYDTTPADSTYKFENLPAGIYQVVAKDDNASPNIAEIKSGIVIYQPDSLVATISKSRNLTCFASTNGSAEVAVTGGTEAYSYLWNDASAQIDSVATGLLAGDYVVTVTDIYGCTDTAKVTITRPDSLNATIGSFANISCKGDSTGTATVVVSGGSVASNYQFEWNSNPVQTDSIAIGLPAGAYIVTVTDDSLCTDTAMVTIAEPTKLLASVTSQTNVKCHGASTGSVDVSVTGGTPSVLSGYSYLWDNGQTVEDATGLKVGTYILTVTDSLSCTDTTQVIITEPDTLTVDIVAIQNVDCNGASTGSIRAVATGGSGSNSYSWNSTPTQTDSLATALPAGIYTVSVTDANLCTATATDTIKEPTQPVFTAVRSEQYCYGELGLITLSSVSGGTVGTGYQYSIAGDSLSLTSFVAGDAISNLVDSTYTVHVADGNGCYATDTTITIEVPDPISATLAKVDITVVGNTDGAITYTNLVGGDSINVVEFSVDGGLTYGDSATILTGLSANTYTVYARNATRSCKFNLGQITITAPGSIKGSIRTDSIKCYGAATATIYVDSITGGNTPHEFYYQLNKFDAGLGAYGLYIDYAVSSSDSTYKFSGLPAGTYQVVAKDKNTLTPNEAEVKSGIVISQPDSLVAIISSHANLTCWASANGKATVSVQGGTKVGDYNYSWNSIPAQTVASVTGLLAGDYVVTVTDANLCVDTAMVTITRPDSLNATIGSFANVSCKGDSTGTATVVVSGGSVASNYQFAWNSTPAQTDSIAVGLPAGAYIVTVTDDSLCTDTAMVTIAEPTKLLASVTSQTNVKCHGASTGSVDVSVTGGTPSVLSGYSYLWDNGQTVEDATGLKVGTYILTVTDSLSCTDTTKVVITEPDTITVDSITVTNVLCNGGNTGSVEVFAKGGTGTLHYLWDDASAQSVAKATVLPARKYTVTITDDNSCSVTASDTVKEPTLLVRTVTPAAPICSTGTSKIDLSVSGGTAYASGEYQYKYGTGSWTSFADGDSITGLTHGSYTVSILDANNCTVSDTTVDVEIYTPPTLVHTSGSDDQLLCATGRMVESIVYTYGGGATGVDVQDLPAGLSKAIDPVAKTVTISGTLDSVITSYNYTVVTTGATSPCGNVELYGKVKVVATPYISGVVNADHCGDAALLLQATASDGTISWYETATGGTAIATGTTYSTPVLSATKTYYVDATAGTCTSVTREAVVARIDTMPTLQVNPVSLSQDLCLVNSTVVLNDVAYTYGGGATGIEIISSNLSSGVDTVRTALKTLTLTGATSSTFNYEIKTIGQKGQCGAVSLLDTVTVHKKAMLSHDVSSGDIDQDVCGDDLIEPIKINVTGEATDVKVTGLSNGLKSLYNTTSKVVTITGNPETNCNYTVEVEGFCTGLNITGSITRLTVPTVDVDILHKDSICPGTAIEIVANPVPSAQFYNWYITKNGVSVVDDKNSTESKYTITGDGNTSDADIFTVQVQVRNINGCLSKLTDASSKESVRVRTSPQAPSVTNKFNCEKVGSVAWNSLISTKYSDVYWYSNGVLLDTVPNDVDKSVVGVSVYGVRVSDSYGCMSDTSYVSYAVFENPIVTNVDKSNLMDIQVTVDKGVAPYDYSVESEIGNSLDGYISLGMLSFGKHEILVVDSNQCSTSVTFEIESVELEPFKYFTPNGDGVNDLWEIGNLEFYPNTEIYIHDRFGKEIAKYSGKDFKGWDGTYIGNPLPGNDYWYVIYIRETGKRLVGHFLLKR